MCTIARFDLGFTATNPRCVVQAVNEFNARVPAGSPLVSATYGIKEFFNHVPREEFERVVHYYIQRHLDEEGGGVYF